MEVLQSFVVLCLLDLQCLFLSRSVHEGVWLHYLLRCFSSSKTVAAGVVHGDVVVFLSLVLG